MAMQQRLFSGDVGSTIFQGVDHGNKVTIRC
jgi:hypothetical protein